MSLIPERVAALRADIAAGRIDRDTAIAELHRHLGDDVTRHGAADLIDNDIREWTETDLGFIDI